MDNIDIIYIYSEDEFYQLVENDVIDKKLVIRLPKEHNKLTFQPWMKKLYIDEYYHELDNLLEGLECLHIQKEHKGNLRLPNSLKYLFLDNYNYESDILPDNLEELLIRKCQCPLDKLPKSVKKLNIGNNNYLDTIPDNIEYLDVSSGCKGQFTKYPAKLNFLILRDYTYNLDNLPNTLYGLRLIEYTLPIDNLPFNLERLEMSCYEGEINFLPINLKILHLCGCSGIKSFDNLPENLEVLSIMGYDKEIKILPDNLKELYISGYKPKKIYFPKNLLELKITSYTYDYDVELEELPMSLRKITLNDNRKTKENLRNIRNKFSDRIEMYVVIENKPLKVGEEYFID